MAAAAAAVVAGEVTLAPAPASSPSSMQQTILSLASDCDSGCAQTVADRLTAAGCTRVRQFRSLGMVAAHCPTDASSSGGGGGAAGVGGMGAATASDEADGGGGQDWTTIPGVDAWEPDEGVTAATPVASTERTAVSAATRPYLWGRDRINQARLPLDRRIDTSRCYPRAGAGVHVFVLDTGCAWDHAEFSHLTRARHMAVVPAPGSDFPSGYDDNGHGTHVAGTVAGKTAGVAPDVYMTCVKVLRGDGNGTLADVVAGFDLATEWTINNPSVPVLLSVSLGAKRPDTSRGRGGRRPIDMAERAAIAAVSSGAVIVAAAGNSNEDACDYTPASDPHVIAVGNANRRDDLHKSSNWGRCVDVAAPGDRILSADATSMPDGLVAHTGTSMAAPHVTGLAALVLAETNGGRRLLDSAAVVSALTSPGGVRVGGSPMAWLDQETCDMSEK
ncbi:hypothetical protein MMPV_000697 [Pyropia vietnamensis]